MTDSHQLSSDACEKWGTCNWRMDHEYDYIKGLDSASVRWEFLRRLSAYRKAWGGIGSSAGAFGLQVLLDPRIKAHHLKSTPRFLDSLLSGGTLGSALPAPPIDVLKPVQAADGMRWRCTMGTYC